MNFSPDKSGETNTAGVSETESAPTSPADEPADTPSSESARTSAPEAAPAPAPIEEIQTGQTVTNDAFEFTLNRVEFSHDVMPDNPPSFYTHYQADSGQVYIYVNASVKNLQKDALECDQIYSVTADYNDGYTYSGFNIVTGSNGNFGYANITSVDPLQTLGVHCLINCPEEVETSENPLFLTITFKDGSKYKYTIK